MVMNRAVDNKRPRFERVTPCLSLIIQGAISGSCSAKRISLVCKDFCKEVEACCGQMSLQTMNEIKFNANATLRSSLSSPIIFLEFWERCVLFLRADKGISANSDGSVIRWQSLLHPFTELSPDASAAESGQYVPPRLCEEHVTDGEFVRSYVQFHPLDCGGLLTSPANGGNVLPWILHDLTLFVVAKCSGDCTILDAVTSDASAALGRETRCNSRFELCHGYPLDPPRENPKVCFTCCNGVNGYPSSGEIEDALL